MARDISDAPKVKIVMTAHGRGSVEIGGVPIADVSAVRFSAAAGRQGLNRLDLELICGDVEIEGPAEVVMRLRDQLPKLTDRPAPTSEPSTGDDAPPT